MQFHVLASGSQGNSTFIDFDGVGVLIDCGISKKQLEYRLNQVGFDLTNIDYVFLTHDHYDHKKIFMFLIKRKYTVLMAVMMG